MASKDNVYKENTSFMSAFDGIKNVTIQRNNKRSMQWFINKIKDTARSQQVRYKPRIGGMYAFVYDAKTKDRMPYWDKTPLDIIIAPAPGGFYGLNFHYLSYSDRQVLLKNLTVFDDTKSNYVAKTISYKRLQALSSGIWKFALKRYLVSQLQSMMIPVTRDEWPQAIMLPIANFQGSTAQSVWRDSNRKRNRL